MNIIAFFNSSKTEGPLSALLVREKYYGQTDPSGNPNQVALVDVNGIVTGDITTLLGTYGAATYHRVFNFATINNTPTTGEFTNAQMATMLALLMTSATDTLSDNAVISISPSTFPTLTIGGKNQVQNTWNALFSFLKMPVSVVDPVTPFSTFYLTGLCTAFTANTFTDSALPTLVNDFYAGYWVSIIAGTGEGQCREITGNNAAGLFSIGATAWVTTPDGTSVYQVTYGTPKAYVPLIGLMGGDGFPVTQYGTTVLGGVTTATSSTIVNGAVYTQDALSGLYGLIVSGTGKGGTFQVATKTTTPGTANTTTTIKLATGTTFAITPDASSMFILVKNESELYALISINLWLWVYCKDPNDHATISRMTKLINDTQGGVLNGLNKLPINSSAPYDIAYLQQVLNEGKAMFAAFVAGEAPIVPIPTVATSGTLLIGTKYLIANWITPDNFTNVGGLNVDGTIFIATGTTPTIWANSSLVVTLP